jgi:putative membrane protein
MLFGEAMVETIPYCGGPPGPADLFSRWLLDPWLIAALVAACVLHTRAGGSRRERAVALAGWGITAAALISPLCALSVSLFSARVTQHMILILVAAPLIAWALPPRRNRAAPAAAAGPALMGLASGAFAASLWLWHLPGPYDATFTSTWLYWAMHGTLFGSAVLLWRTLIHAADRLSLLALLAGGFSAIQMGLLGALLTLASEPLFAVHAVTTRAWGLTQLGDQQLGGLIMWVPGGLGFLWAGLLSVWQLLGLRERSGPAAPDRRLRSS